MSENTESLINGLTTSLDKIETLLEDDEPASALKEIDSAAARLSELRSAVAEELETADL